MGSEGLSWVFLRCTHDPECLPDLLAFQERLRVSRGQPMVEQLLSLVKTSLLHPQGQATLDS